MTVLRLSYVRLICGGRINTKEHHLKSLILAAGLALASTTAFAGGMAEPVMEPEVVAAKTSSSAGGIIVPLLLLLVVAAAIAGSNNSPAP